MSILIDNMFSKKELYNRVRKF